VYSKYGGVLPLDAKMTDVDWVYTWTDRAWNLNSAVHLVGTWKGDAVRANDTVLFRASNSVTFNSLTFGRQRSETGLKWLNPKSLGPKENDLHITIEWSRPVRVE
jgi:hypothetical protein